MKRLIPYMVVVLALTACGNYDILLHHAISSYEKKGAIVVSYCDPPTEDEHFLLFQKGGAVYVNFLDKNRPTEPLMNATSQFRVLSYTTRIDNVTYQFTLDSTISGFRPLTKILGSDLDKVSYYATSDPYKFLMAAPNGVFFFDVKKPDRLLHLNARNVRLQGDRILCNMVGDLREYHWDNPIPYSNYYFDSQEYEVIATFDLAGHCLSFSNLKYGDVTMEEPLFIDSRMEAIREAIEYRYESDKAKEMQGRFERLRSKAREDAISVVDILSIDEGGIMYETIPFYCPFSYLMESDKPGFKYAIVSESNRVSLCLYSNDDAFLDIEYPAILYVFGRLYQLDYQDSFFGTKAEIRFDNGIFAGLQ